MNNAELIGFAKHLDAIAAEATRAQWATLDRIESHTDGTFAEAHAKATVACNAATQAWDIVFARGAALKPYWWN